MTTSVTAAAPIALSSAASRSAAARARLRERVARLHAERSATEAPSVSRVDAV